MVFLYLDPSDDFHDERVVSPGNDVHDEQLIPQGCRIPPLIHLAPLDAPAVVCEAEEATDVHWQAGPALLSGGQREEAEGSSFETRGGPFLFLDGGERQCDANSRDELQVFCQRVQLCGHPSTPDPITDQPGGPLGLLDHLVLRFNVQLVRGTRDVRAGHPIAVAVYGLAQRLQGVWLLRLIVHILHGGDLKEHSLRAV